MNNKINSNLKYNDDDDELKNLKKYNNKNKLYSVNINIIFLIYFVILLYIRFKNNYTEENKKIINIMNYITLILILNIITPILNYFSDINYDLKNKLILLFLFLIQLLTLLSILIYLIKPVWSYNLIEIIYKIFNKDYNQEDLEIFLNNYFIILYILNIIMLIIIILFYDKISNLKNILYK